MTSTLKRSPSLWNSWKRKLESGQTRLEKEGALEGRAACGQSKAAPGTHMGTTGSARLDLEGGWRHAHKHQKWTGDSCVEGTKIALEMDLYHMISLMEMVEGCPAPKDRAAACLEYRRMALNLTGNSHGWKTRTAASRAKTVSLPRLLLFCSNLVPLGPAKEQRPQDEGIQQHSPELKPSSSIAAPSSFPFASR